MSVGGDLGEFAQPAGSHDGHSLSPVLQAGSSRSRRQQGWFSLRSPSWAALPSVCVLTWSSLYVSVRIPPFYKDPCGLGLGLILTTSFYLNHLFKTLSPNTVVFGGIGCWGFEI